MTDFVSFIHRRGLPLSAAALFLLLLVAYLFSIDIRASRGASITGDEPFYLLTTQSLIRDGDLDLTHQFQTRSYEEFFDHPHGLWRQYVPSHDGRLLSPHNPGLSLLLVPGFLMGGLPGAQVQLVVIGAGAMTLAYLLAVRFSQRPDICWLMTLTIGLSATAFIYSSEIYPEFPAAMALLVCLLIVTRKKRLSADDGLFLVIGLTALLWLGIKYAPLAGLVAAYFLYRSDNCGRLTLLTSGLVSGAYFIWFHLVTFDSLTPYNVNVVYAGQTSFELIDSHVSFVDRFYRLWGLLIDRRFGIGRWAPILLSVVPAMILLVPRDGKRRLLLGLISIQVLIATFVAITMMGWWFPGRTLLTVLPLFVVPLALLVARANNAVRWGMAILALYGIAVTGALAYAGHTREVTIAVDPFDMRFPLFGGLSWAFPQYTYWNWETWLLTIAWLAIAATAILFVFRQMRRGPRPTLPGAYDREIQHTETLPESGRTSQQTELS